MNSQQAAANYWRSFSELKVIRVAMENHIAKRDDQGVQDILSTLVEAIVNVELDKRKTGGTFPDLNKVIEKIESIDVPIEVEVPEYLKEQA